jgi:hypothetical protein
MTTIPASAFVRVTPSVLNAGGRALDIIGMMLTDSWRVPYGTVQSFGNRSDVTNYFGDGSNESALAAIYFAGFTNSNIKPGRLSFAQYPREDVGAYLRGGSLAGMSLTQLQAVPVGAIALAINGATITAPSVNLSTATSFSNAASIMKVAFTATQASASGNTISGTTLTLGGTITGTWAPGQTVVGVGVTSGSYIVSLISGTPNTSGATYLLSASSTVGSPTAMTGAVIPNVTFDSVSNGFLFETTLPGDEQTIGYAAANSTTTPLNLTQAAGAVISQGTSPATPTEFMNNLVELSQNWATFMTTFDPDNSGNDVKYEFAQWNTTQNNRWCYACWDTDESPSQTVPATQSLGYRIQQAQIGGTFLIGGDGTNNVSASYAAFACAFGASLNFSQLNGRTTMAYRRQDGLVATCSSQSTMNNLISNGYNFYGVESTANDSEIFMYPGSVSGEFLWMDSYINQIWMNNSFQLALLNLLLNAKSIPYNQAGYSLIQAAAMDTIEAATNFGAVRAGVTLSNAQAAEVNDDAGLEISTTLNQRGWVFQVLDASPQVRQVRGSPPCTFWYMDGQSVQQIELASVELV